MRRYGLATTQWLGQGELDPLFVLWIAVINRAWLDAKGKAKTVKPNEQQEAVDFLRALGARISEEKSL